jgi:hypothetical protein
MIEVLAIILIVIGINVARLVGRRASKSREPERRREEVPPQGAPEPGTAASAPRKGTAATEVDRFFEELARQSGATVPPRAPAPPQPRPPVAAPHAPAPHRPAPAARAPAPARPPHAPTAPPQPVMPLMAEAVMASVEPEPITELPAITHLTPLGQAVVLREILGPCRWFRPYRVRGW